MIATANAPPTRLPRPLPRPVRPVANETLASFLHRLAAANRLDHDELRSYIAADSHKRARIPLDRLAALSGQPELTLRRAIFDLPPPAGDPTELSWPGPGSLERLACRLCMARRGTPGAASVRLRADHLVCPPHQRWLGDSSRSCEDNQPSLANHPEILDANRHHRRLIHQHGDHMANACLGEAHRVCAAW